MKIARDRDGKALHKDDNVFYQDKIWAVDRIAGTKLYLSFFGATTKVDAKDVAKYR